MNKGQVSSEIGGVSIVTQSILVRSDAGKNDLTQHGTPREDVSGSVIHSIFDAWH